MNKNGVIYCFLAFTMILLAGCGHQRGNYASWASISPEVDSVNGQLENDFKNVIGDSVKWLHIQKLCSISENHPDNLLLQSRVHYWKGRHYNRLFQLKEASRELDLARKFCDSILYPYDFARINHEHTNTETDVASIYSTEIRLLDYFTQIKDSTMMSTVCMTLSSIFRNVNDTVNYKRYLKQAEEISTQIGNHNGKVVCLINSTGLYGKEGADSILNIIRTTPGIEDMRHLYYIALYNSFLYTDNVKYLETLLSLIKYDSTQQQGRWHVEALISLHDFEHHSNQERAMAYSQEAFDHLSADLPLVMQSKIRQSYAHNLLSLGRPDTAMRLLSEANDIYVDYLEQHRSGEMLTHEASLQIQKEKEMYDKMCKLDRTRYFLIVGGVLLAAVIILFNLYLLLRNARAKKVKLENELTVNRNHLAATQLVTTTKSQLIDSMITAVKEMKNKGTMSTNDANSLLSSLKTHISAKDELDSFIRIHETLHPKFATTLGERCPGIPESMIRLASYVAMGYTTQQIAEMLSIGHATVNKNRYRLRTRLGLARNESLEHYLRTLYAEEDPVTK